MKDKDYPYTEYRSDGVYRMCQDGSDKLVGMEKGLEDVENAVGREAEGKRGIAQRIDELEDRIAALEKE